MSQAVNGPQDGGGGAVVASPGGEQQSSSGGVLKRTLKEFQADNVTDWAAALTYYGVLSIFPALLALVSILGLVGKSATQPLITNLGSVAPGPAKTIFTNAIQGLQHSQGAAGVLFVVGILAALWSASGYVAAFTRASNAIFDVQEGRPVWKTAPLRIVVTLVIVVLLAVTAVLVVVSGGLAAQVGKLVGVGNSVVTIWDIAKWPVLVVLVALIFAILYRSTPNVKQGGMRTVLVGGLVGVIVWLIASAAFAVYVANFSSYNKTYGTLGGVIAFLVWLWVSNIAILIGAEFNAERQRGHQIDAGHPPDREPFLEPRDTRKMKDA